MFDIGWSEILVIAVVAIVVVGPKELPRMLRAFGKTMGQVRRTANDFRRQFDEALREAERDAGLDDTRKQLQAISRVDPLKDAQKELDATMRPAAKPKPISTPKAVPAPPVEPTPPGIDAQPPKTAEPAAARGSDAA
jgi:sec-independent protein translocase protein TatB